MRIRVQIVTILQKPQHQRGLLGLAGHQVSIKATSSVFRERPCLKGNNGATEMGQEGGKEGGRDGGGVDT